MTLVRLSQLGSGRSPLLGSRMVARHAEDGVPQVGYGSYRIRSLIHTRSHKTGC